MGNDTQYSGGRVLALFTVGMATIALVACSSENASTLKPRWQVTLAVVRALGEL